MKDRQPPGGNGEVRCVPRVARPLRLVAARLSFLNEELDVYGNLREEVRADAFIRARITQALRRATNPSSDITAPR